MGGIVTKRREDSSARGSDASRSAEELGTSSHTDSGTHEQHPSRVRGADPFQRNQIRRVRSVDNNNYNSNVGHISSDSTRGLGQSNRPPLHPTRSTSSPATSTPNNLYVDTTNNNIGSSSSSSSSTPRVAVVTSSTNSTPMSKEQMSLLSFINQTPVGDERSKFQYYCPLCMRHFQETLVVPCCNNYICFECTVEYLSSKSIEATRLEEIMSQQSKDVLKNISCPQ